MRTLLFAQILLLTSAVVAQQDFLDLTFNADGILVQGSGPYHIERPNAVVVRADGGIVVGGQDFNSNTWVGKWFAFRCNSAGEPDTSFGPNGTGYAGYDMPGLGVWDGSIYDLAEHTTFTSNNILCAGYVNSGDDWKFTVMRLLEDGSPDPTFSGDGVVWMDHGSDTTSSFRIATAVSGLPDGRIMAAGFDGESRLLSARLLADGSPDTTYAPNGMVELPVPGAWFDGTIHISPTGEVFSVSWNGIVVKLDENGLLDPDFGNNGVSTVLAGSTTMPRAIALRPSGQVVLGCWLDNFTNDPERTQAAQLTNIGELDLGFGIGGVTPPVAGTALWVNDVVVLPSGRVAVGYQGMLDSLESFNFLTAMFTPDGMVDSLWGVDGVLETDLDMTANPPFGSNDAMWGLTCQADGKLVGTGPTQDVLEDIGIVRYAPESALSVYSEHVMEDTLFVFPNPCGPGSTLQVRTHDVQPGRIMLLDVLGREVATWQKPAGRRRSEVEIPTGLAGGQYVLGVRTARGSTSIPLIIER